MRLIKVAQNHKRGNAKKKRICMGYFNMKSETDP
jgi:hypothetical protein